MSVYTESGELVDKRVVLRWQDGFDGEIKGSAQPYNLNIAYKQSSLEELDIIRTFCRSYIISPLRKIEMSHTVAPPKCSFGDWQSKVVAKWETNQRHAA